MSFYRKPPWWMHHLGIEVSSKGRMYFYLWNWVWEPGCKKPDFGDCVLGILSGLKPTKKTDKVLGAVKKMTRIAELIVADKEEVAKNV